MVGASTPRGVARPSHGQVWPALASCGQLWPATTGYGLAAAGCGAVEPGCGAAILGSGAAELVQVRPALHLCFIAAL
jgi:hypothetical protein